MSKSIADITLDCLRYDAVCLADRADTLARHASFIDTMPDFRTAAEAELERAERELKSAYDKVRDVRANIRPVRHLVAAE
jgi:hypothetical protein